MKEIYIQMKKNLKSFLILALVVVSILGTAVSAYAVSTPKLSQTSATVIAGKKLTLKVLDTKDKVSWKSSNKKVAVVSSTGVVKGKTAGNVNITAKVSGKVLTCKVEVKNADSYAAELQIVGSNGGDFVSGESEAEVRFKLENTSTGVQGYIVDDEGEPVYTEIFKKCKKNKEYTFSWDGGDADEGSYKAVIVAGDKWTASEEIYYYRESDFDGGNGSESNPYQVSNVSQLEAVARHNERHFIQTDDIDFEYGSFVSLCTYDAPFIGVYDGGGYSIKNILNTSSANYYGIFRAIGKDGTIKNLVADECNYKGNTGVGIIAGYNFGIISECNVKNCLVTSNEDKAGGICGFSEGIIKSCEVVNTIVNVEGNYDAGGICGWNGGIIRECNSTMNNMYAKYSGSGGIVGANDGTVSNCKGYNNTVSVGYRFVGGIVGYNEGTVNNCEVTENEDMISGNYYKGGICGSNQGSSVNNTYYGNLSQNGN